jgi:outer membrane translocation and assembly module TamA
MKRLIGLHRVLFLFLSWLLIILSESCSTLKYVPENENLLNNVDIKLDNKELDKEKLFAYIRQRENTRILGFLKFHLWLYNLSKPMEKENWLKRTGEPPQIYNSTLAEQSVNQLLTYLHNKGYYNAKVYFTSQIRQKKRKTDIRYNIHSGQQFLINKISYDIPDTVIRNIFKEYKPESLKPGSPLDLELLDNERDNIIRFFKNKGYYHFSKPMLFIEADTTRQNGKSDLKVFIQLPGENGKDSLRIFRPYYIDHYTFNVLRTGSGQVSSDTINTLKYTWIFPGNLRYSKKLFMSINRMGKSDLYSADNAEVTFEAINRLRQFRFINIYFQEKPNKVDTGLLSCFVDLSPLSKQSTSFEIEGTNTSGNFGIAGNLNYSHKNLFHGAEILNMRVKGAMERQQAIVGNQSLDFNTRELGIETTLTLPQLIGPGSLFPSFGSNLPKTLFTLGYNFQRRPDYTRTISSMKLGYEWKTSEFSQHNLNLIDFNLVNLSSFDQKFMNSIYDLYIKGSFTDHLIVATNYSYIFNNQPVRAKKDYSYMRISAESSGNLLNLFSALSGVEKKVVQDTTGLAPQSYYELFRTRYAQYLKSDIELRKGYWLNKYNSIVGRFFVGVGVPYGNFDVLPFEKKYFTGGANGIRAWQVRSLGPGTYKAPQGSYPNQSGDIKLEGNIEYRYKLIKFLEGAFFLDAGNVWAINEKDNRKGAQFKPGTFYKQLAIGTGTGFRFDFDYFIFRLDLGLKVRDPAQTENKGWIVGARKLQGNDFNFSFAIGYPF